MAGKFPCPHAGCTLLERHPGLCVFANLSDKRGRRDSTQENTTASMSIVQAAQPVLKRKLAPPPPAAPSDAACALATSSCNDHATMLPPEVLNSTGMDPNRIPFPDIARGGDADADESGRAAEDVGTLSLFEGSEAAVDGEAPTEGLADREGPGQRRPEQQAQPLAESLALTLALTLALNLTLTLTLKP